MRARSWANLSFLILVSGCEAVNAINVCDSSPSGNQLNERGDGNQAINNAQAAADIGNGHALVAFVSQSLETDARGTPLTSQIRIAIINSAGQNVALCDGSTLEWNVTSTSVFAYSPSVARAPLTVGGTSAVGLVSWTQGTGSNRQIHMLFVDAAGCPINGDFVPYQPTGVSSALVWSASHQAVLATIMDDRSVYTGLVNDVGPEPFSTIATTVGGTGISISSAMTPDGTTFLAWTDQANGPHGALVDGAGAAVNAGTDGSGLDLGFPETSYLASGSSSVSVTARTSGFAVLQDASVNPTSPPAVYIRNFGLDGAPLGPAYQANPGDNQTEASPSGVFLGDDVLAAVWQSRAQNGTVAGLFGLDGTPRFNTVSCHEGDFAVGPRGSILLDTQSAVLVDNTGDTDPDDGSCKPVCLWVFYTSQLPRDGSGTAVGWLSMPISRLWPGAP